MAARSAKCVHFNGRNYGYFIALLITFWLHHVRTRIDAGVIDGVSACRKRPRHPTRDGMGEGPGELIVVAGLRVPLTFRICDHVNGKWAWKWVQASVSVRLLLGIWFLFLFLSMSRELQLRAERRASQVEIVPSCGSLGLPRFWLLGVCVCVSLINFGRVECRFSVNFPFLFFCYWIFTTAISRSNIQSYRYRYSRRGSYIKVACKDQLQFGVHYVP